jgi:hypothetical protein
MMARSSQDGEEQFRRNVQTIAAFGRIKLPEPSISNDKRIENLLSLW